MPCPFICLVAFLTALLSSCTNAPPSATLSEEAEAATTDALTLAKGSRIVPHVRPDLCLTALNGDQKDGSKLTLTPCTSIKTQLFTPTEAGTITTQEKMCLDVTDGKNENGATVQLWKCSPNNTNQKWENNEEGVWTWVGKNKCLDIADGNFGPNARLQIWDCNNRNKNQLWRQYSPIVRGTYIESGKILSEVNAFDQEPLDVTSITKPSLTPAKDVLIGSLYRPGFCLDVHDIEKTPFVQMYTCNGYRSQQFNFTSDGQIQFPNVDVKTDNNTIIAANSLCLSLGDFVDNYGAIPGLEPCDDTKTEQKWTIFGDNLVNLKGPTCLGLDVPAYDDYGIRNVLLQKCTKSPALRLNFGSKTNIEEAIAKESRSANVASVSRPWIQIIDRTSSKASMTDMMNQFGGADALARWVSEQYIKNNQTAYSEVSQVPRVAMIKISFEQYPGIATAVSLSADRSVKSVYLNYAFFKRQSRQEILRTLAHELAHCGQHPGLPFGMNEGYANWIRAKAFDNAGNKRALGGSWKEGYDKAQYFLEWIDQKFPSAQSTSPIAVRMNLRARSAEINKEKDWFEAWFRAETGQDIETMWARYQADPTFRG